MTDQEINEKIGWHFGWRHYYHNLWIPPKFIDFVEGNCVYLPNWSGDLNLMREAETTIGSFEMPLESGSLQVKYWDLLCESDTCCIHVGSRERALAFIKLYNL